MNIPISKKLTEELILPCIVIACVGIFDLYSAGQKRFEQNVAFIILFGIPTILFAWFLLDKRLKFKEPQKVRKSEKLFRLPFSTNSTLFIFLFSPLFLVGGIAIIIGDKNFAVGFPMLIIGLISIVLTAVIVEHPKVWFADTINMIDLIKEVADAPLEDDFAYRDGIFSYADESFDVEIDDETKSVNWDDITLIVAYKIDRLTIDSIVIEIYLNDAAIRIDDQTAGYMKFMETAAGKLKYFRKDWFQVTAFPAFETNLTTIYESPATDEK